MSGSGSGTQSSTTTTSLPKWEIPYAKSFLSQIGGLVDPNGQLAAYNPALNQQVAGFSPDQQAALGLGASQTGGAQGLANLGAGTVGSFAGDPTGQMYNAAFAMGGAPGLGAQANNLYASGAMLNPATNPYLNAYANAAAGSDIQQYLQATQPSLAAQAVQTGTLDSSGFDQAQSNAQYNLGQSLASLNANIYEPAYQLGTQEQLQAGQFGAGQQLSAAQFGAGQALGAAQGTPSAVQGLYGPTQALYGLGATQQQQQQNVYNAGTQNAQQQANWPFNLLSQLGSALGLASGGGGITTSTGPVPSGK